MGYNPTKGKLKNLAEGIVEMIGVISPDYYKRYKKLTTVSIRQIRDSIDYTGKTSKELEDKWKYDIHQKVDEKIERVEVLNDLKDKWKQDSSIPFADRVIWKHKNMNKSGYFGNFRVNPGEPKAMVVEPSKLQATKIYANKHSSGCFS